MTAAAIVLLIAVVVAILGAGLIAYGRVLAHRGEAAAGHADEDESCALTRPAWAEYVPPMPHPALHHREREMAGTPAALLATRLTTRSIR